jgi:hypothetical protein
MLLKAAYTSPHAGISHIFHEETFGVSPRCAWRCFCHCGSELPRLWRSF